MGAPSKGAARAPAKDAGRPPSEGASGATAEGAGRGPADETGRAPLAVLADRLAAAIDILAAPSGLEVEITHPVILDRSDPLTPGPGSVVLAVGIDDPASRAAVLSQLEGTGVAAVAFKQEGALDPAVLAAADRAGTAVLGVHPDVSWGQLFSLLATASTTGPAAESGLHGVPLGDLFALANGVSALVGGATTIEDPQSRVLAYSSLDHPIDIPRQETILGRQVPVEWMKRLRDSGVFRRLWQTDEVVPIEDFTEHEGYLPRLAVAVRAGGELLGSIWVIQGDRPFGPEACAALRQAADIAALHLLAHRSAHDVDRQRRADALLAVLEGRDRGDRAGSLLGIETRTPVAVLAFEVDEPNEAAAAIRAQRVVDLIALYCESYRRRAACAVSRGRVYALVPLAGEENGDSLTALAEAIVSRSAEALQVELRAGIGSTVTLPSLAGSRHEADEVLDVLEPGSAIAGIETVRPRVVLRRLARLAAEHRDLMEGRLTLLIDQDRARGTSHLATLRAYFDAFGDVVMAAAQVNVHPNTFRYRLRRISESFGIDLADPDERLVAQLQIRLLADPALRAADDGTPGPS